jgi:cytochrome c556
MRTLKNFFALALPLSLVLTGVVVGSEDAPPEHKKWMKEQGELMGKLRKGVEVEASAKRMAEVYKEVEAFWAKRTSDVAGKTCKDGQAASMEIATAAAAGNAAGVGAGMKNLGATCKGCHDAHREKISDTEYKIK